jgi:diacylglycerol kinase (ATP)
VRVILVHNPEAGDDDHNPAALAEAIEAAGHTAYRIMTVDEALREELTGRVDLVAVAGGDGTVRTILKRLAGRPTPVTVIPVGTANNIARAAGFDVHAEVEALVRGWDGGAVGPFDLGVCYCGGEERRFAESAGAGILAEMLVRGEDWRPPGMDKIEHGLRLLRMVLEDAPAWPFRIEVDGRDVSADLLAAEVTNVPEAGPLLPLDPEADPRDGLFEAVLVDAGSRGALLAYVDARLAGESPEPPRFETHRGRRIALGLAPGVPLHVDDEMVIEDAPGEGIRAVAVEPAGVVRVLVPAVPR